MTFSRQPLGLALALLVLGTVLLSPRPTLAAQWRIRHGSLARLGQFPMIVLLWSGGSMCTASIVGPNKVLTAGHCVCGTRPMKEVRTETLGLSGGLNKPTTYRVSGFETSPSYRQKCRDGQKGKGGGVSGYDIAMITISGSFRFGRNVKQASLLSAPTKAGQRYTIVGFGQDTSTKSSGTLKFGSVVLADCPRRDSNLRNAICFNFKSSANRQATGPGDSGGPMLDRQSQIVGVVSGMIRWGSGPQMGIYAGVAKNFDFVRKALH